MEDQTIYQVVYSADSGDILGELAFRTETLAHKYGKSVTDSMPNIFDYSVKAVVMVMV